eukprot:1680030-Pleurochrysis_carterae.AAC.1
MMTPSLLQVAHASRPWRRCAHLARITASIAYAWAESPLLPASIDRVHFLANEDPPAVKNHKKA